MDGDRPSLGSRYAVTLAIRSGGVTEDDTGYTAASLVNAGVALGGMPVSWTPVWNGAPAKARFAFHSEDDCRQFMRSALEMPAVSLLTPADIS
jgi:hypothetical protein